MNKRYNKSESRKGQPYNKSKRRRPHPSYQTSTRTEKTYRPVEVLEKERGDALDFDIKIPEVDWQIPSVPDVDMGELAKPLPEVTDVVPTPKTQAPATPKPDVIERPEVSAPKTKSRQPKVKVNKTTTPSSLGQQPTPKQRAEQAKRDMLRRQQQQQQSTPNGSIDPGAIVAPIVMMVIALVFISSLSNPPTILYFIVMFFFGRHIWSIIQGQK